MQRSLMVDGKRKYLTGTGATPAEAQARLDKNSLRWSEKSKPKAKARKPVTPLDEAVWSYHKFHRMSPNARYREAGIIRNHLEWRIEHLTLEGATEDNINDILLNLETTPKDPMSPNKEPLGSSTRRSIFYILHSTFRVAERNGKIPFNPMRYLDAPPKTVKQNNNLLAERFGDYRNLYRAILLEETDSAVYSSYINPYVRWVFALWGMRQSERLGLTWDNFLHLDKKNGNLVISIQQQLYNDAVEGKLYIKPHTKTQKGERLIPLDDHASQAFRRFHQEQKKHAEKLGREWKPAHEGLVFTTRTGGFIRQAVDNTDWKDYVARHLTPGSPPIKGHGARHLFASMLAEAGVQEHIASALLGHSTAMVSYYTHINNSQKQQAIARIGLDALEYLANPKEKLVK